MGKLRVIKAGNLTTIQDEGRFGYRQFGIPQSGVMDKQSMHNANKLVGNPLDHPVIESVIQGLELEALEDTIVAVSGAESELRLNEKGLAMNVSYHLTAGDVLSIAAPTKGLYYYLAIAGAMNATNDFGSVSTYLMAGFGGLNGKAVKKGDVLETYNPGEFKRRKIVDQRFEHPDEVQTIRIIKGPEWNMLKDLPEGKLFQIDPSSNRMGIRLKGEPLGIDGNEIISSAVIPGTIQLPHNGLPIVLMNDCQTTGGYPRIGKVIDDDMGAIAQIRPGANIRLEVIALDTT